LAAESRAFLNSEKERLLSLQKEFFSSSVYCCQFEKNDVVRRLFDFVTANSNCLFYFAFKKSPWSWFFRTLLLVLSLLQLLLLASEMVKLGSRPSAVILKQTSYLQLGF
jgi:hypothetical protein